VRHGSRPRKAVWLCGLTAVLCGCMAWPYGAARGQGSADPGAVSAWATGGASTTARPDDKDGKPGATGPATIPFWQAPALPSAVIQGTTIPPGWQPQAVPYQGIGPDGRPVTMYFAPTYVFTYQSGPPVLGVQPVNRPQAWPQPASPQGWNYATSGAAPVSAAPLPATVARYAPPYQFPADSRALTGTPIAPPSALPPPPPPPQTWGTAPPVQPAPPMPPPPSQWGPSDMPPPPGVAPSAAPAENGWAAVAPPAVAGLAAGAQSAPPLATLPPPVAPIPPAGADPAAMSAQAPDPGRSGPPPSSRAANSHLWRVVGVQDGDTVTCLDETNQQQKIRLADIDAPEIGQDYGNVSREALAGMVFGRTVEVADDGRDRYGRWIGHLSVDGFDVNRQMVATGNAWHYAAYSSDQSLAAVQAQAQSQRLGFWEQPNPVPPWDYRKQGMK